MSEDSYATILVSIWELGEVVGPFVVGPLSEKYGRLPVYHIGNVLFVVFSVASAVSSNISMLVAFRFLTGLTTTSMTLGPSIVGDCFPSEERGRSMAIAVAIPQIGPFAGPVIGGYLAEKFGWRWSIWFVVIFAGLMTLLSALLFKETYKPVLLERKALRLRAETGNEALRSKYQAHWDQESFLRSVTRPIILLFSSPIVFILSFYNALVYGLSYLILTTLAGIMQSKYGFSEGQTGLLFFGRSIGNFIGMLFFALTSDRYVKYMRQKRGGETKPEDRLPHLILGAVSIVIGILMYGWTAYFSLAWILPIIGTGAVGFSMVLTMLPAQNYLVDVFDLYAASAIAASNTFSALFGALFPLCGPPLYRSLGLGWGNSVLAFVFLVFLPVLVVLHRFGERIRMSPRFKVT